MFKKRKRIGLFLGFFISLLYVFILSTQAFEYDNNHKGKMNTGHENLNCSDCHVATKGTLRQQIQAKVKFILGIRKNDISLFSRHVENYDCLACHKNQNDRHPVFRFLEPRFEKARDKIGANKCESCHKEHSNKRVTISTQGFCINCHQKLKLKKDPLDVSHESLIKDKKWETCLRCHDFHGSHEIKTPSKLKDMIPSHKINSYFNGEDDPYSKIKHSKSLKIKELI